MNQKLLLVGNGSYANRGCEAIVRGTLNLLENGRVDAFDQFVCASPNEIRNHSGQFTHPLVNNHSIEVAAPNRFSQAWFEEKARMRIGLNLPGVYRPISNVIGARTYGCAMQIGGDNFSLEYGTPDWFVGLNQFLLSKKIPVVIWGASLGPFEADPRFEARFLKQLEKIHVFVRESLSHQYLEQHGIDSTLMVDPAFAMAADNDIPDELDNFLSARPIGINVSPLIFAFRYAAGSPWDMTNETLQKAVEEATDWVENIRASTAREVLLIPHVGSQHPYNDDFEFLKRIRELFSQRSGEELCPQVPGNLNAAQLKALIAGCSAFVGARTHSTIAALSSGVPTISLGYSLKSRGINLDCYGHLDYCLNIKGVDGETLVEKVLGLLDSADLISASLRSAETERIESLRLARDRLFGLVGLQ